MTHPRHTPDPMMSTYAYVCPYMPNHHMPHRADISMSALFSIYVRPYTFHIRTHMNMYTHAGTTGARRVSVAPRLNQHAVDIYTYAHTPTHHQRQRHRPPSISTSIHTYIYMRGTHPHLPPTTPTASPSKRPTSMRGGTWAKQ